MIGYLSGGCRLTKRTIKRLTRDLFGLEISVGMICKWEQHISRALAPIYDDLQQQLQQSSVHVDDTGWREGTCAPSSGP
jgi:hypothetical protein